MNPLAVDASVSGVVPGYEHVLPQRPAWHACACCPPNLARLIASLGKYLWSEDETTVYSHLFIGSEAETRHGRISMTSGYPWEGKVVYTIHDGGSFMLAIHVPHHAKELRISVNEAAADGVLQDGYDRLHRTWAAGDQVTVQFDMPARRIYAHHHVRDAAGKVALARGPLVYCVEDADHDAALSALVLPEYAEILSVQSDVLDGMMELRAQGATQLDPMNLYSADKQNLPQDIRCVPYFAWGNRTLGNMLVWIRET